MNFNRALVHTTALLALSVALAACGGKKDDFGDDSDDKGGAATSAATVNPATAATITGSILFEGTAPKQATPPTGADPVCATGLGSAKPEVASEVAVTDGKLANVFVYISSGLESTSFPTPTAPASLKQEGCHFVPHVVGMMVGQPLSIINDDATLHNVHGSPATNPAFNFAQPTKGMEKSVTFEAEEVMIPVSCDVHGWMRTYIGVLPHPCFATSAVDGSYSIAGLPPGNYTLTAWHEKYGKQEQKITVAASEKKTVGFTFKGS